MKENYAAGWLKMVEEMNKIFQPYQDVIATIQSSNSFSNLILDNLGDLSPSVESISNQLSSYALDTSIATATQESLSYLKNNIDTSWLEWGTEWIFSKNLISNIDLSGLLEINNSFTSLIEVEQEVASLPTIPENLISVSAQIASITSLKLPNVLRGDSCLFEPLLSDYCELAIKQYSLINKSFDFEDMEWHLGVLEAASKYVDRQVSWTNYFANRISELEGDNDITDVEELDKGHESGVALIPTYIGYTKRGDINKTPSEGLAESVIVEITEKGKKIFEGILTINNLVCDNGNDRVFGLSEKVVNGMLNVATTVCVSGEQLGNIIDGLYFIFYENLEHIKTVVGNGNKTKGDKIVRSEAIYQVIFNVKTIRSDLRHDLNHGSDSNRRKKLKSVGDCYKSYCGGRPIKEKDFKKLQIRLYDEIIALENELIEMLRIC